jgi:hypothetical protein
MSRHPQLQYHERTLPFAGDPLEALTRLTESTAFTDFVIYEGRDSWSLGGGVLAEISLDRTSARSTVAGATDVRRLTGDPLGQAQHLLTNLPIRGWRAYGWSALSSRT